MCADGAYDNVDVEPRVGRRLDGVGLVSEGLRLLVPSSMDDVTESRLVEMALGTRLSVTDSDPR